MSAITSTVTSLAPYALAALMLALLFRWLLALIYMHFERIGSDLRRYWRRIALIPLVLTFLLADLPYIAGDWIVPATGVQKLWIAVIAGNWFFPDHAVVQELGTSGFAASIVAAVLLNNALYVVVAGVVWKIARGRKTMDRVDGWIITKFYVENAMDDLLEDSEFSLEQKTKVKEMLQDAFKQGVTDTIKSFTTLGEGGLAVLNEFNVVADRERR